MNAEFRPGEKVGCSSRWDTTSMFDVETVFLFPWAVVVQDLGINGLLSVLFFLVVLTLGLAYAWKKGALTWK